MNRSNLSVIIIEDHSIIVEGLSSILSHAEGLSFDGSFYNAKDALAFLRDHKVDIILLDIGLPDISGIELCSILKRQFKDIRIIAITNHTEKSVITEMLASGADGYLLKNSSKQLLIEAIFQVSKKQFIMPAELQRILFSPTIETSDVPRLTAREKEILQLVSQGITTSSIASKLFVSIQTVETHRRNLMQKLKVSNSPSLIRRATELGLL